MENDPSPESQPVDPMAGPKIPFNPNDFGYTPELLEDHQAFIAETRGDLTLFLLMESARSLEQLRGTAAAYPELEQRLQSFQDKIELRKLFLDGES